MNYTLDQLLALEAVHRLGSFSAAATSLCRATSAISYSIKSLEEALKVDLFDRSGHRAQLTPEGELILLEARRVTHLVLAVAARSYVDKRRAIRRTLLARRRHGDAPAARSACKA